VLLHRPDAHHDYWHYSPDAAPTPTTASTLGHLSDASVHIGCEEEFGGRLGYKGRAWVS